MPVETEIPTKDADSIEVGTTSEENGAAVAILDSTQSSFAEAIVVQRTRGK